MDTLSKLYGWLTGTWTNQSILGRAGLGCLVLLLMACLCGVPLVLLSFSQ